MRERDSGGVPDRDSDAVPDLNSGGVRDLNPGGVRDLNSGARSPLPRLTLYGKPGCCLCDEARAAVAEVGAELAFELEEVDVSVDPRLHRQYGERIPVLDIDGEEAFELGVEAPALRDLLGRVGA